jgi:hypothetical protein
VSKGGATMYVNGQKRSCLNDGEWGCVNGEWAKERLGH